MRNRALVALGSELRSLREERIPQGAAPGSRTKQEVLARLLADELRLSKPYDRRRVSDWERGAILPPKEAMIAYAQLYGTDPEEAEDLKRKLLRLWELGQREPKVPWWRTRLAALPVIAALLGLLVALVVRESETPSSPRLTLHRFSKPDGRCRLNTRTDLPILRDWHHDGAIANVEVSEDTGAEPLLSYALTAGDGTTYHTYVRAGDKKYLNEIRSSGWRPTSGQVKDVGLVYPERKDESVQLWRGRKGLAHCLSTDRAELERGGYGDLQIAGYVWPRGG